MNFNRAVLLFIFFFIIQWIFQITLMFYLDHRCHNVEFFAILDRDLLLCFHFFLGHLLGFLRKIVLISLTSWDLYVQLAREFFDVGLFGTCSMHDCGSWADTLRLVNLKGEIEVLAGSFDGQKIGSFVSKVNFSCSPSFSYSLSKCSCCQIKFCQKTLWWELGLKFGSSVWPFLAKNVKKYNNVL